MPVGAMGDQVDSAEPIPVRQSKAPDNTSFDLLPARHGRDDEDPTSPVRERARCRHELRQRPSGPH